MNRILRLTFVLLALSPAVFAADLNGRVVGISDGDIFTLLTSDKPQVKIRLAEIDALESGQPYGNKSKQALSGLIYGNVVFRSNFDQHNFQVPARVEYRLLWGHQMEEFFRHFNGVTLLAACLSIQVVREKPSLFENKLQCTRTMCR